MEATGSNPLVKTPRKPSQYLIKPFKPFEDDSQSLRKRSFINQAKIKSQMVNTQPLVKDKLVN